MPDLVPLPILAVKLASAVTHSDLITEAQRIQHLPEYWQREHAAKIVKRRLTEFKKR